MDEVIIPIGSKRPVFKDVRIPNILTFDASWNLVEQTNLSLARLGDGELLSAAGQPCGFEGADESLAYEMRRILSEPRQKCLVGINRAHFFSTGNTLAMIDRYCSAFWPNLTHCDELIALMRHPFYLDACLTIPRHHYVISEQYWSAYFNRAICLLAQNSVILVTGDDEAVGFYKDNVNDLTVVHCAMRGAWKDRKRIAERLRGLNGDGSRLVVAVCGPTATWLAYELCDEMRVLDLGHLSREYQYWKRGSNPSCDMAAFFGS